MRNSRPIVRPMALLILVAFLLSLQSCSKSEPMNVLIYTFLGEGYKHANIESAADALLKLCEEEGLTGRTANDPAVFNEAELQGIDAVIFCNTNEQAFLDDSQREEFRSFIEQGGGFMGVHSANTSEPEWDWFVSMVGGRFRWHPPYQEFEVLKTDPEHPSVSSAPERWTVSDECYYTEHFNPAIQVLLSADMTTVEDSTRGDYPGPVFGDLFPLCWCQESYGGRQWVTTLGHDAEIYSDPVHLAHLRDGLRWVLALRPS